jgi:hypothetical protein
MDLMGMSYGVLNEMQIRELGLKQSYEFLFELDPEIGAGMRKDISYVRR